MSKIGVFVQLETADGLSSINVLDISAFTESKLETKFMQEERTLVTVHLNSGTIFTTFMSKAQVLLWRNIFNINEGHI